MFAGKLNIEERVFLAPDNGAASGSFSGSAAQAKAESPEAKLVEAKTKRNGDFVMPELSEILKKTETAQHLSPERLKRAYEQASTLDITNAPEVMNFGLDIEKRAGQVTRQFIEQARSVDLEQITKLANESNREMEKLGIGDMKPSYLGKFLGTFLPAQRAKQVQDYLNKHRSLTDTLDKNAIGMTEERAKLLEHYNQMKMKIDENREIYDDLSEKIGVAELSYEANIKRTEEQKKKYLDTKDAAQAREVQSLDQALARQARRINTLKASRQETLTALTTMDLQLEGITSQISLIDEQQTFNRLVWDNAVLMTATNSRMKNAVQAVEYNRKKIEEMIKERGEGIGETLGAIIREQKEGVVNAAVLEYAAAEVAKMNRTVVKGAEELRQKMKESSDILGKLDSLLKDSAGNSAAMTDADEAKLDEILAKKNEPVAKPK